MCMIAHRPLGPKGKGSNIPNLVIDTALTRHPDGWGVAWREGDELRHEKFGKSPQDRTTFRALLKSLDARRDVEYVAHFRFATHGEVCKDMSHPFSYMDENEGEVLVFHNGIVQGVTATAKESDTAVFVRDWISKLPSAWWRNEVICELVDKFAGWSKFVIMTQWETVNLNFSEGTEDGGLWYSSEHKPYWQSKTATYTNTSGKGDGWVDYDSWEDDNGLTQGAGTSYLDDDFWQDPASGVWYPRDGAEGRPAHVTTGTGSRTTQPRSNDALWLHEGHDLEPLQKFDFTKDGDYENSIICNLCGTAGDVYLVDGKAYVAINHGNAITPSEDEREEEYSRLMDKAIAESKSLVLVTDGEQACSIDTDPRTMAEKAADRDAARARLEAQQESVSKAGAAKARRKQRRQRVKA